MSIHINILYLYQKIFSIKYQIKKSYPNSSCSLLIRVDNIIRIERIEAYLFMNPNSCSIRIRIDRDKEFSINFFS